MPTWTFVHGSHAPPQVNELTFVYYHVQTEDKEWGRLLLSLSYLSEKNTLCVGLVQATDLPTWRNLNSSSSPRGSGGGSDPFVKV